MAYSTRRPSLPFNKPRLPDMSHATYARQSGHCRQDLATKSAAKYGHTILALNRALGIAVDQNGDRHFYFQTFQHGTDSDGDFKTRGNTHWVRIAFLGKLQAIIDISSVPKPKSVAGHLNRILESLHSNIEISDVDTRKNQFVIKERYSERRKTVPIHTATELPALDRGRWQYSTVTDLI